MENIKKKDIKNMTGVYVGETGTSIHERAKEHQQDALTHNPESHMFKHWKMDHHELEEQPSFKIKIVGSFRDALSRQISESVRIDLRGGNVLNSKTEYSRCTLPRLTVDREQWKQKDKKEAQEVKIEVDEIDLMELRGTAWQLGLESVTSKKRKNEQGGRKAKKRKLEKLENWGELEEVDIRSWLTGSQGSEDDPGAFPAWSIPPTTAPSRKLKQMEWNFARVVEEKEVAEERVDFKDGKNGEDATESQMVTELKSVKKGTKKMPAKNVKKKVSIPKKKIMAALAKKNKKMTGWLVMERTKEETKEDRRMAEKWQDAPEEIAPETLERLELAKKRKARWQATKIVKDMLQELVDSIGGVVVAKKMVERVWRSAWWQCRVREVWLPMENDVNLQRAKMNTQEREKERVRKLKVESEMIRIEKTATRLLGCEGMGQLENERMEIDSVEDGMMERLETSMRFLTVLMEEEMGVGVGEMEDSLDMELGDTNHATGTVMDWEDVEKLEHRFLDCWRMELGVEEKEDAETPWSHGGQFRLKEELLAHEEIDKWILEAGTSRGGLLEVQEISVTVKDRGDDDRFDDRSLELDGDDELQQGQPQVGGHRRLCSGQDDKPVQEDDDDDGSVGGPCLGDDDIGGGGGDYVGLQWYGREATWYMNRWIKPRPESTVGPPCKVGGRGKTCVCVHKNVLCAHRVGGGGGASIMSHRIVCGHTDGQDTKVTMYNDNVNVNNVTCSGKRKRRCTGWGWPRATWTGTPRTTLSRQPGRRLRRSTLSTELCAMVNLKSDKDIKQRGEYWANEFLVPGGVEMTQEQADAFMKGQAREVDSEPDNNNFDMEGLDIKPGHSCIPVKELPGKDYNATHINHLLVGADEQAGQVREEGLGGVHCQQDGGLQLQRVGVVPESKRWDTVKVRKTRGVVRDGLVQVRISNFLKSFPNLNRRAVDTARNVSGPNTLLSEGGLGKRKSLEQLGGPEAVKRLRK